MDGILFLSAILAIGIVILRAILDDSRAKGSAVAKANAGRAALLQPLSTGDTSPDKPSRRRSF